MTEFRKDIQCSWCAGKGTRVNGWEVYNCSECSGTGRRPANQKERVIIQRAYHQGCGGKIMVWEPVGADKYEKPNTWCQNPKWVNPKERVAVCEKCGDESPEIDWR